MPPTLRDLEHHQDLHVHTDEESRDCDGRHAHGSITWLAQLTEGFIPDTPEADDLFKAMMIYWEIHFWDETNMQFGIHDDERLFVRYGNQTEEGFRSGQLMFCEKQDCREDQQQWQRDYTAEAMGY